MQLLLSILDVAYIFFKSSARKLPLLIINTFFFDILGAIFFSNIVYYLHGGPVMSLNFPVASERLIVFCCLLQ